MDGLVAWLAVNGVLTWLAVVGIAWLVAMPITFGPVMRRAQANQKRR
jgi:hypothetical protein